MISLKGRKTKFIMFHIPQNIARLRFKVNNSEFHSHQYFATRHFPKYLLCEIPYGDHLPKCNHSSLCTAVISGAAVWIYVVAPLCICGAYRCRALGKLPKLFPHKNIGQLVGESLFYVRRTNKHHSYLQDPKSEKQPKTPEFHSRKFGAPLATGCCITITVCGCCCCCCWYCC